MKLAVALQLAGAGMVIGAAVWLLSLAAGLAVLGLVVFGAGYSLERGR